MKKILAIQFKYFGDAVFLIPSLLAIKEKFPDSELHLLVAKEISPVFKSILDHKGLPMFMTCSVSFRSFYTFASNEVDSLLFQTTDKIKNTIKNYQIADDVGLQR